MLGSTVAAAAGVVAGVLRAAAVPATGAMVGELWPDDAGDDDDTDEATCEPHGDAAMTGGSTASGLGRLRLLLGSVSGGNCELGADRRCCCCCWRSESSFCSDGTASS